MKWGKKRSRFQSSDNAEINVTPLIDVALTLLIVFMVTTPMIKKEKGLHIQLPKGDIQEVPPSTTEEITICIDAKRAISLNNKVLKQSDLLKQLKETIGKRRNQTVFIKADQSVSYGVVIELVTMIKTCEGVGYVALPTASTL